MNHFRFVLFRCHFVCVEKKWVPQGDAGRSLGLLLDLNFYVVLEVDSQGRQLYK